MKTSRRSLTSEEIVNQLEQQSKKDQREQKAQLNDRQEKIRARIAQRLKKRKEAYEERLTNSKILQKIEIFQHLTDTTLARIIGFPYFHRFIFFVFTSLYFSLFFIMFIHLFIFP